MKPFDPEEYYRIIEDLNIKELDNSKHYYAKPYNKGLELINEFYSNKYNTNIEYLFDLPDNGTYDLVRSFNAVSKDFLSDLRKQQPGENYRKAFLFGDNLEHEQCIIYIRENVVGKDGKVQIQEAFLYSDSRGRPEERRVQELASISGIDVFVTTAPRQADSVSCYTEGLTTAKIATQKLDKEYKTSNLLSYLRNHASPVSNNKVYAAMLPDPFLKTTQISDFYVKQKEKDEKIIHKNETISQVRARYNKELYVNRNKENIFQPVFEKKQASTYLQQRGFKNANIMEIQFYLKQIEKEALGFTEKDRADFIKNAKSILKSQGSPDKKREGLFNFATNYLEQFNKPKREALDSYLSETKQQSRERFVANILTKMENLSLSERKYLAFQLLTLKDHPLAEERGMTRFSKYSIQTKTMHIVIGSLLSSLEKDQCWTEKNNKITIELNNQTFTLTRHPKEFIAAANQAPKPINEAKEKKAGIITNEVVEPEKKSEHVYRP